MPGEQLSSTYSERITHFEDAIRQQTGRINLLSLARLVVLVSAIWILVLMILDSSPGTNRFGVNPKE